MLGKKDNTHRRYKLNLKDMKKRRKPKLKEKDLGKRILLKNNHRTIYCLEFVLNLRLFSELFALGEEVVSVLAFVLLAAW